MDAALKVMDTPRRTGGVIMKHRIASAIAALAVAACTPAETKPEAATGDVPAQPAAEAVALAPISLVGQWTGTITCYKIESPLTVNIDGGGPEKAEVAQGEGGALKWMASVSVDSPTRMVTLKADTPTDGADVLTGLLSEDMMSLSGAMTQQLCTDFALKRMA